MNPDPVHAAPAAAEPEGPARPALPSPSSLFLAGSRERLLAAGALVAVLWLLVWWALD